MKTKFYIKEFVKDQNVGAITSTSDHVVKKIIEKIDFIKAEKIVEYGPGNGVITRLLLDNMNPGAVLYVFEKNETFIDGLLEFKDKRLVIIHADAEFAESILKILYKVERVDYIISTLPFTFLKKPKRRRIIYKSFALLNKNGRFITYQYSWLIFNLIKSKFRNVKWTIVLLNLPPAIIIDGVK